MSNPVTVYRMVIEVIDYENYYPDEVKSCIEMTEHFTVKVHDMKHVQINNWSDNHPLNKEKTHQQTFLELFK